MAKRRSSSFEIHTTPPKSITTIISIIVFVLGLIGALTWVSILSPISFWLLVIGYAILLAGVLMRDL